MAGILNLLIVIMEMIAYSKVIKAKRLREGFIYYTQISNFLTLISSLLLVIFGQKKFVEVFRLLSVSMLVMTFFVTVCILVPMSGMVRELLFSGSCLYHHLLVPVLSVASYLFVEERAAFAMIWLPITVTLIYGIIMVYLNAVGKVDGPYPFFRVRKLGVKRTAVWIVLLLLAAGAFSAAVGYHWPIR